MGVSPSWTSARRRWWWWRTRRRAAGDGVVAAGRPSWLDVEASALAATTTSVAVMAPALTEGGPQKPENLLPALPTGGFLSAKQAKQVCQNREVLAQFVVSANVQPSKIDEQCLHGIPKDLINDVINLNFGSGLDGLSDLIAAVPARKEAAAISPREAQESGIAIMNDSSMGDPADSMCFFKIMGSGEAEESCEIADLAEDVVKTATVAQGENNSDEVDAAAVAAAAAAAAIIGSEDKQTEDERSFEQIFASDINVPRVEELLQVIKSMGHEAESAEDGLGGENRLVEASSQSTSEGVSEIFPDGEAFPLNLLNDVDMIGLCNDNMSVVDQPHSHQQPHHLHQPHLLHQQQQLQHHQQQLQSRKLAELAQHQAQVERRQHELERRASFLVRRLRKLQSRLVGEHVAEEASYVLELAQQSAKKCFYQGLANLGPKAGNSRNFPDLAGSLTSFLQKVQKSCSAQSNSIAMRQRNSCRYFGSGSKDNYVNPTTNRVPVFGVPQIKLNGEQIEKVAGPLATKLKILQNAYDSDCTASSSGGESCDEMQNFNNPHRQQLPIAKRAGWRYAQDRASVASRWVWLQAQIADLEYKIRLHNELHRQIRTNKGMVMLEAEAPPGAASTVNGYSGVLPGSRDYLTSPGTSGSTAGSPAGSYGASRTRPFIRMMFRKRKLVQLDGLHETSKKAARPASVRCSCDGSMAPCAICTGRRDLALNQEAFELLSVQERVAMLDPGFHSVLSLPEEIIHTVHMDAIMRSTEWQQKILRSGLRISKLKDKDSNERRNKKVAEHRTKYPARLKKSQTTQLTARIKRKVLKGKRSRSSSERANHGINRKRGSKGQPQQPSAIDEEEEASALSSSSKYSSPVPSPLQQPSATTAIVTAAATTATTAAAPPPPPEKNTLKEKSSNSHSRLRQNSYDIDNIVIPYSVASSTRLEKLPYKEILIPKWRLCDDPLSLDVKNGAVQKSTVDSDVEDVSDEAIAQRHERSEKEENKRFMTFMVLPHSSRLRHNRRADSGTNTPDPMSPHAADFGGDVMLPIISPPATPSNVHDTEHSQQQMDLQNRSGSLQNALRRRTLSSSVRSQKEETTSSVNEEEHEQVLPYESRTFPLTDEDYEKMLEAMPGGHLQLSMSVCSQEEEKIDEAEIDSQESDSTESALCDVEGEDPNDPEWTVAESRETEKDRIRPTAKR